MYTKVNDLVELLLCLHFYRMHFISVAVSCFQQMYVLPLSVKYHQGTDSRE